ncbi:hypothetical protein PGTUg99_014983 [Puccinia graminis f. sp. tritici]|uniref:Uncharacterized protein n=1 Tax=Puccinia graminis f. sp. tritici TaxID=56615 RepID=A0A5B0SQ74_PUCGR|nr:hypothetical protein PGTUg99_014983 [Puccinia graminis f. sp. tritici]
MLSCRRRGFHFRPNTRPAGDSQRYVDLFERPAERRVISQGSSSRHPTRSLAARLDPSSSSAQSSHLHSTTHLPRRSLEPPQLREAYSAIHYIPQIKDAALKLNNSTHQLIDPLDSKPLQARSVSCSTPLLCICSTFSVAGTAEISSTHLHTISNRFTTPFIAPLIPAIPLWVLLEP